MSDVPRRLGLFTCLTYVGLLDFSGCSERDVGKLEVGLGGTHKAQRAQGKCCRPGSAFRVFRRYGPVATDLAAFVPASQLHV